MGALWLTYERRDEISENGKLKNSAYYSGSSVYDSEHALQDLALSVVRPLVNSSIEHIVLCRVEGSFVQGKRPEELPHLLSGYPYLSARKNGQVVVVNASGNDDDLLKLGKEISRGVRQARTA